MIIALNGYAKSGKDEVAKIIQKLQPNEWEVKKFSGKLKQVASLLTGIPLELFEDQRYKQSTLSSEWDFKYTDFGSDYIIEPMTVRVFLQKLGTDAVRNGLHYNAWVNALMCDYKKTAVKWDCDGNTTVESYPKWIITDCRFPNEFEAVKDNNGIVIRINRAGIKPVNNHPSEIALDDFKFDFIIENNGSLKDLEKSVILILNKINDNS